MELLQGERSISTSSSMSDSMSVQAREMPHPALTRVFLQPAEIATIHCHLECKWYRTENYGLT